MQSRRTFLGRSSLAGLLPVVPRFLTRFAEACQPARDDRILVVIELGGGNDGVNTLVPYSDEGYSKHRKKLFIPTDRLLKLDDQLGLHPRMRAAAELWEQGKLSIVPSVGYPGHSRSHDVSQAVWHSCRFTSLEQKGYGWLGRALDQSHADTQGAPSLIYVGDRQVPIAIKGRKNVSTSIESLADYRLPAELDQMLISPGHSQGDDDLLSFLHRTQVDGYQMAEKIEQVAGTGSGSSRYPASDLGHRLNTISHLMKSGFGTRGYYTYQSGYDTHSSQIQSHGDLLGVLSEAIKAFLDDLNASKLDDRVLVLCFSEFGRRVDENASHGTDHGAGGLAFLAGSNVNPGVHGRYSSLLDLDRGALKVQTDFRQVYATVLNEWLNVDSNVALDGQYESLPLIDKSD